MAKGARKKTKWVSLSLDSATATTVPPAENDADESSKSARGTKPYTAVAIEDSGGNYISAKHSDSDHSASKDYHPHPLYDRNHPSGVNGRFRRQQAADGSHPPPFSNGHHSQSQRNYTSYAKGHYSSNNYYHSSSSRKSYYSSHNGGGSYRSSFSGQYTADAKNEQNSAVTINDDEYTKITTPRQDVLFKKGYLSRPKKYASATTTSDNGLMTASSSGNGTTDGSDIATGSGSVSTAESITSDSTYQTEGHFMDYPGPYPYFGYFDQSGVLVMNGFAVDSNGFSYMNGGQTYIYPSNYHCQLPQDEEGQTEVDTAVDSGAALSADQVPSDLPEESETVAVAAAVDESAISDADISENIDGLVSESASCYQDAAHGALQPDETGGIQINPEVSEVNAADCLDQQVPQQHILSPYANGYDYAQFYNALYYPGCVMTPFPMLGNGVGYDQFGVLNEEEHARQLSFKKRKKRYRNWEEYPTGNQIDEMTELMYQDPNYFCIPEAESSVPTEVPVNGIISEHTQEVQQASAQPPNVPDLTSTSGKPPSSQPEELTPPSRPSNPKPETRSQPNQAFHATAKSKSNSHKGRKRDLIESTLAFAEQNIDLTKGACRLPSNEVRQDEANAWRTVRNGREIAVEEDRELRYIDTRAVTKLEAIKETPETAVNEQSFQEVTTTTATVETALGVVKQVRKDVTGKKGKKTAKGKGKKPRKLAQQLKGFEVTEPEFAVSVIRKVGQEIFEEATEEGEDDENVDVLTAASEQLIPDAEEVVERLPEVEDVDDVNEEELERDLYNVQIDDLQVIDACVSVPVVCELRTLQVEDKALPSSNNDHEVDESEDLAKEVSELLHVHVEVDAVPSQMQENQTNVPLTEACELFNSLVEDSTAPSQIQESETSVPVTELCEILCSQVEDGATHLQIDDLRPNEASVPVQEICALLHSHVDERLVQNQIEDILETEACVSVEEVCELLQSHVEEATLQSQCEDVEDKCTTRDEETVDLQEVVQSGVVVITPNDVPSDSLKKKHDDKISVVASNEKEKLTINLEISNNLSPSDQLSPSSNEEEGEEIDQSSMHFSGEEYYENFDSGLQSPAAFTASSTEEKERKSSSSSYNRGDTNVTDAVTKWLSETLSNKRLEEMFVLPEDPTLLHRIHQFNFMNFDDSFAISSDTYSSSSGDEAEDVDSDYMSDVQVKKRQIGAFDSQNQKTESQKDQLAKQTANGHHRATGDHSIHKQKRCIIM